MKRDKVISIRVRRSKGIRWKAIYGDAPDIITVMESDVLILINSR